MAPITPKTPKKATPSKRVLGSEMVVVLLGAGPKHLRQTKLLHRNLLTSISGFFARGLNSGFRESETKVFELEEEDAATFSVFEQWVYKDRLYTKKASASESASFSDAEDDDDGQEWGFLPRLYTLGERLDAPNFKDAVISAIIEKVAETNVVPDTWASYVYQNTVSGNTLRRLIVDFHVFAHQGRLLSREACPDAVEPEYEFLRDVVQRVAEAGQRVFAVGGVEMPWGDACLYHEHGEGACHLAVGDDVMHTAYSLYGTPQAPVRRSARCEPDSVLNATLGICQLMPFL
ncbi:hypothetical protein E4T48_01382 [Aureobasidium sp. EXF-10727]|nr:hypothetical protein E4T48_01382 [Aureobasidium sp. EXF-10727]